MKENYRHSTIAWLWTGVTIFIVLLLVWLTIFEYWNS